MPASFTRLLLLLALLLAASKGRAQTIDTEAATAYWKMTDALRRNEPLTDAKWREFLELPANKVYMGSVFGSDTSDLQAYRRAIEVVYMPRYDSLLQVQLRAKRWYYVLVNNYKEHEKEHQAFLAETAKNPAYLEKMYTYAYEYLPTRAHRKQPALRLYYTALGDDATSQQAGIVFSLYDAYSYQRVRPGILEAHELHHQLLGYALTPAENLTRPAQPGDEGLLWLLRSALIEGLADLTDKQVQLAAPTDSAEMRQRYFQPAPAYCTKWIPLFKYRQRVARPRPKGFTAASPMVAMVTCRVFSWLTPSCKTATASPYSTTPTTPLPLRCSTRKQLKRISGISTRPFSLPHQCATSSS